VRREFVTKLLTRLVDCINRRAYPGVGARWTTL